jgi:lipopolysaccharide export system permease protein
VISPRESCIALASQPSAQSADMKIIHKYIIQELLKIFVLTSLFLTLILFVDKTLFLTEMIINRGVTLIEVIQMMTYIAPAFLGFTIPISVLISVVVVFNQFSADNEIVVMKASGWSFTYLLRPVMVFSLMAYLLTNFVVFYLHPWGNQSFKELVFHILETRANVDIKPQVFNRDFKNLVLFVSDKKNNNHLNGIFIADKSSDSSSKIILANEGYIVSDPEKLKIHLHLIQGTIHENNLSKSDYQVINFDRYDLTLGLPGSEKLRKKPIIKVREMSVPALLKLIKERRAIHQTTYYEETELSKKFSIPVTCFLFALVGAPLGIKSRRTGKSGGFVVAVAIIVIYYVILVSVGNLGSVGKIHSLSSVWIPNILLLIMAIYMVYKTQKERPFAGLDWIYDTLRLKKVFEK